jgi:hypothetical protein
VRLVITLLVTGENRAKRELEFYQSTCIQVSNYIELKAGAQASFEYAVYIF